MEDIAVTRFRSFLRIKSVQPDPDYVSVTAFLRKYATEIGLEYHEQDCVPGRPMVWLTLLGIEPTLPSVLLNCHSDVVPVFPDQWKFDPFEAVKDEDGKIYARGSQDMKCVGVQYMEALRKMLARGDTFKRTIHVTFPPEEELGGFDGTCRFIQTDAFRSLNAGVCLDEGLANPGEAMRIFHGEKTVWWIRFCVRGRPGHTSQAIEGTAPEKLAKLLGFIYERRTSERARLDADDNLTLGDIQMFNVSKISGGVQSNVVPDTMEFLLDVRVAPNDDARAAMRLDLDKWCAASGGDITMAYERKQESPVITSVEESDPWWRAFKGGLDQAGVRFQTEIFPAGTDGRYLRDAGVPVYGFSPINNTPILLHDHNEYLDESVFLRGVDIYMDLIGSIANVKAF